MSESSSQPDRALLPLEVEQKIARVSDEFERAWKSGQSPRIEDHLDRVPAVGRLRLLEELLVVEFDLRQQQSPPLDLDIDTYLRRFPGSDAVIDVALGRHERHKQDAVPSTLNQPRVKDADQEKQPLPQQIGRFLIRRRLGQGGFGVVYLAHDPGLDRLVALKVPRPELLATGQQRENFLHEARTAAKLKHPSLVTVYEVPQEGDLIYIVQEYIEGQNLAQWAAARPCSWEDVSRRLVEIATAIGYVHQQGFYHRDLKPGNILIDNEGHAHVADFGLAVHEDALWMLKGKTAGTPQYMAPEQVRGETHWIDDRTDIWALGVILYELLSGHRPFTAPDRLELLEEIQERDPKSPRTKNPAIPKELERICFKCLAKRRTHRYANASDLLEDLQAFLATCPDSNATAADEQSRGATVESGSGAAAGAGSTVGPDADSTPRPSTLTPDSGSQPPLRIVPKGLRSFDKEDKDFFLELLPGPRDREGLPDTIRFWKTRIEEMDTDATFPVGVMYGPSGCGKSSLVKAGLLPHLASHVLPIFIEATPNDTELRLLKTLRKHLPCLAAEASLAETLAQLREGDVTEGQKVLLVLDQFEQWLHSTANMDSSQLVRTLRQCDGANVQGLILVRDDFWMSTTRFMQALEVPQVENQNSAAIDLFDPSHAHKVLRAFGLAYSRLPEHDLSADQQRFLDRAVQELTHDGKVICVQLSLFADMMKGRPWTPVSLQEVGGTSGVGVAFLDETFTAKTAPPTHRLHAKAAQAVLKALLPEVGTDIKGQMQPAERLLECSGYATRPDDFRDLLQILNRELRLITPTEPEEAVAGVAEPQSVAVDRRFYQLTHDYLVQSLGDWLTRKQKETRRGRAELKLAERSALWNAKPENRHLPSLWEYGSIRALTRRRDWNNHQRNMMKRAGRVHAVRWGTRVLVALFLGIGIQQAMSHVWLRSLSERLRTAVATMARSRGSEVSPAIENMAEFPPERVRTALNTAYQDQKNTSSQKLALVYALAKFGQVERQFLLDAVSTVPGEEVDNVATALAHDGESALQDIVETAQMATSQQDWKLKTRLATVALYMKDTSIAKEMLQAEPPAATDGQSAPKRKPNWYDRPLDPSWTHADDTAQATLTAAHGMLTDRFAYCLDMPWTAFSTMKEALDVCNYRPTRVRPFVHGDQRLVAAIWVRDGGDWRWEPDLTAEQLPPPESNAEKDGLVPADLAAYPGEGETILYCLLWSPPTAEDEQRRLRVGMTKNELEVTSVQMVQAGLRTQKTLQVFVSADGTRRYAGIWSTADDEAQSRPVMEPPKTGRHEVHWEDISVAGPGKPPHPLDVLRDRLTQLTQLPPPEQESLEVRLERAKVHYYLDQPEDALEDLDPLLADPSLPSEALLYCALCRAQLGKAKEAEEALAKLQDTTEYAAVGQILTLAWLGKVEEAKGGLDALVLWRTDNFQTLYSAASVAAQISRIRKDSDPAQTDMWKQHALGLLRQACGTGYPADSPIENDPDFIPLWEDPTFQLLLNELADSHPYAGVLGPGNQLESWVDTDLSLDEQQQAARERAAVDFRPVAVTVRVLADQSDPHATLIWRRPKIHLPNWDPVQRTMFIEYFPKCAGSVEKLAEVLRDTDNNSLCSGMSLAIGSVKEPSSAAKKVWQELWAQWYTQRRDNGTHSATGWALRTWSVPLPEIPEQQLNRDGRGWQQTKTGLTMIRIPAGEVEGAAGEYGLDRAKRIRILDEFWLSDREVTTGQFLKFVDDKDAEKLNQSQIMAHYDRGDASLPVSAVTWHDAVMFCNWLSRREDLEPCYAKNGKEQIRDYDMQTREYDAWKLVPGANGYRLPTDDEWEYACRATTTTVFAFGDDEDLLDRYAVFVKNAKDGPSAVGEKLCNAWGLFDMHGNMWEWCQDQVDSDRNSPVDDPTGPETGAYRVYRGGCCMYSASYCRSACRSRSRPDDRNYTLGFRVARSAVANVLREDGSPPTAAEKLAQADGSEDIAVESLPDLGGRFLTKGSKSSWAPDGTRLVFSGDNATSTGGGLSIIELATGKTTRCLEFGKDPAWAPGDGRYIAYVIGEGNLEQIWIMEPSGDHRRMVAIGGFPSWSSDGTAIYFHSRKLGKLMSVNIDATSATPKEIMDCSTWWYPAFSADGQRVAYLLGDQLIIADCATGKTIQKHPSRNGGEFLGSWSPDGKYVAYGGWGHQGVPSLWVVDVVNGSSKQLAEGSFTMPVWSPDGSKIALDLRLPTGFEIWICDAEVIQRLQW